MYVSVISPLYGGVIVANGTVIRKMGCGSFLLAGPEPYVNRVYGIWLCYVAGYP